MNERWRLFTVHSTGVEDRGCPNPIEIVDAKALTIRGIRITIVETDRLLVQTWGTDLPVVIYVHESLLDGG